MSLEKAVVRKLKASRQILCTVESCTGGLISNLITDVSGASEVFWGSFIVYDNSAKEALGISKHLITTKGAVSPEVAYELAERGLEKMQNAPFLSESFALLKPHELICLSTTGIAGPSGGTSEKPVGLCYMGIAISGKKTRVDKIQVESSLDRIQTKSQFAQRALEILRELI